MRLERWFAELTTKWIKRDSHRSVRDLTASADPHLDHQLERRPQTVCLAQERRRDPRQPRRLLPADQRLGTLDSFRRGPLLPIGVLMRNAALADRFEQIPYSYPS